MATVAYWAKAQLASPARQRLVQAMLQRTARARGARPWTVPHGAQPVHVAWRGAHRHAGGSMAMRSSPQPS
jgi:hypothetical protein